ncbi:hypothetical protein AB0K09_26445 [Streptomyces sp. NPDC049577]|uniref:hypothetical protein n=1 Tax=Streptomyces sp. NPDC049577 TaxID=3155153 RepID=UPI003436A342
MHQEAVPDEAVPSEGAAAPQGAPKGLLQQMEELMAALNADLTQLDADLRPAARRPEPDGPGNDAPTAGGAGEAEHDGL